MDVIGFAKMVAVAFRFFFRNGRNNGNQAFSRNMTALRQTAIFFLDNFTFAIPPPIILTNLVPSEQALLEQAFIFKARKRVHIQTPQRGDKRKMTGHAELKMRAMR